MADERRGAANLDRRRFLALSGGAAFGLAERGRLAAAASAHAASAVPARQEKTRLRYGTWATGAGKDDVNRMLADFMQSHPTIEVVQESAPDPQYQDALNVSLAGGDPPDVFWMWFGALTAPMIDAGFVLDPAPYYEQYNWNQILIPWVVESIKRHDKPWGVPTASHGMGFWYRTDLFQTHGVEVPQTYEQLEQACQTLSAAGVYALSLGGKFGWNTMRLTDYFLEMTAGPELHDQLNRLEARWDGPEVVAAYELLRQWIEQGWIVPDFLNIEPGDARLPWYQGEAAMVFEGDWMEGVIKGDEQDIAKFDFFLPPTGHEPFRYSAFPEQIMIAKASQHPDAAAEFIDWWISLEVQTKYALELAGATATLGVTTDPNEWPRLSKWRQIIESTQATYPPTDTVFEKELMDAFFEVQDGVLAGQFSPEEGATLMQERAEEWKAKTG